MYIKVHAYPNSKDESVEKIGEDTLEIHVREAAEGNRANRKILELVRKLHSRASVRLVSGHQSRHKILSITQSSEAGTER
jgi:uncharacterized protein (TIGR00251 family)